MKITIKNNEWTVLKQFEWVEGKTLLKQAEENGVEIPNACHQWMCAACMCHIESGGENIEKDFRNEPAFPLGEDEVMTCIGGVIDDGECDEIVLKTMY